MSVNNVERIRYDFLKRFERECEKSLIERLPKPTQCGNIESKLITDENGFMRIEHVYN